MSTEKKKELTTITSELLERTNEIKENAKKSMMIGEVNVIRGIIIFEVILKEINHSELGNAEINAIKKFVDAYMIKQDDILQRSNNYVNYGIALCYLVMDNYNKMRMSQLVKTKSI